ncbi:hypothetical protein D3C75_912520 [compost metagenome]
MILRAVFDVNIEPDFGREAELLGNCGGSPLPSFGTEIPSGRTILRKGSARATVNLGNNDASECIDNMISISSATARTLGLINKRRYRLSYNTADRSMTFLAKPVSRTSIAVRIGSTVIEAPFDQEPVLTPITDNEIFVSAIGAVALGLIKNHLLMSRGSVTKSLRLKAGEEIFVEPFMQVTPAIARKFGLTESLTPVSFNQISSVLRIDPGK